MNPRDFEGLARLKTIVPAFELFTVVATFVGPVVAPTAWLAFVAAFMAVFVLASVAQVRRMATFVLRLRRALPVVADGGGGSKEEEGEESAPLGAATVVAVSDGFAHAFVVPNYNEPPSVLRSTLATLAAHPGAKTRYLVTLGMEAAERGAPAKAAALVAEFGDRFHDLAWTLHEIQAGEAAGKAANVDHAARSALERARALGVPPARLLVTVMDADAHVPPQYVTGVDAAASTVDDPHTTIYAAPIVFERNFAAVPALTRVHDAMWSAMAAQNLGSSWGLGFPISNYTVPARLLRAADFWDTGDDAIGEDLHMFLKCYFKSGGKTRLATVPAPINMLNLQADGYGATIAARAVQAERHARGVADVAYSLRQVATAARPLPRLRTAVLMLKLVEAQVLPATAPFYMGIAAGWALLLERWGVAAPYGPAARSSLTLIAYLGAAGAIGFALMAALNECMRRLARTRLYRLAPQPLFPRCLEYLSLALGMWIFMVLPSLWAAAKSGLAGAGVAAGAYVVAEKLHDDGGAEGGGVALDSRRPPHAVPPPASHAAPAAHAQVKLGVV